MERIKRDRRLTAEEAEHYASIRKQIEAELPELLEMHQLRTDAHDASTETNEYDGHQGEQK